MDDYKEKECGAKTTFLLFLCALLPRWGIGQLTVGVFFLQIIDDPDFAVRAQTGQALVTEQIGQVVLLAVFCAFLNCIGGAVQKRQRGRDERQKIVIELDLTVMRILEDIGIQTAGGGFSA